MSWWEESGHSDEWYTPKYVIDALGGRFDLDVASPLDGPRWVPCDSWLFVKSLELPWWGYVWMNPPFGGRNGLVPWLNKFMDHGNGVALVPDRSSTAWWQDAFRRCDLALFVAPKIKFERPDGSLGDSPATGTTLMAKGDLGCAALRRAALRGLGVIAQPVKKEVI